MATYKEIFGTNIEVLASDPANPVEGQVWYNSTDNVVKGFALTTAGAWATGGNMNTARRGMASAQYGTQSAALGAGGNFPDKANTESYNGSAWTEVNDLNTARGSFAGAGTQTLALAFGGDPNVALTESWNGTSWTEVNDLNQGRNGIGGAGVDNTSALCFGGQDFGTNVETWNGTSWTEVNDLNTFRRTQGWGTQTSAIATGGFSDPIGAPPKDVAVTESWNGTSWTEVNDLNTARNSIGTAGTDNTSGLAFGGSPTTGATEIWNGTSWSEDTDLNTARNNLSGAGTDSSALAFGGYDGTSLLTATEEWTGAGAPLTVTFTDS